MSKLIVEMEMPKCCWDCSCCDSEYRYCAARKKTLDELNERPDWCPICGVLPDEHGDLVDYNEVEKEFNRLLTYMEEVPDENGIVWFRRETIMPRGYVMKFHIIVPAERKDDDKTRSNTAS